MTRMICRAIVLLGIVALAACGDDGGGGGGDGGDGGGDGGDGGGGGNTGGSTGGGGDGTPRGAATVGDVDPGDPAVWLDHELTSSADYDWSIPSPGVEQDDSCAKVPDDGLYGPSYSWEGWEHDGTVYTCNACPGGRPDIQGDWRWLYDGEDPDENHPGGDRNSLRIVGNTWLMRDERHDPDYNGYVEVFGWYFCGSKPEVQNETTIFVVTEISEEGALGWESGVAFSSDVLTDGSPAPPQFLWGTYLDVKTVNDSQNWFDQLEYCRVGTKITSDFACPDPFGG